MATESLSPSPSNRKVCVVPAGRQSGVMPTPAPVADDAAIARAPVHLPPVADPDRAAPPVGSESIRPVHPAQSAAAAAHSLPSWPFSVSPERIAALAPAQRALLDAVVSAFVASASAASMPRPVAAPPASDRPRDWLDMEGFDASDEQPVAPTPVAPASSAPAQGQDAFTLARHRCGNIMLLATRLGNFVNLEHKVKIRYYILRKWAYQKTDPTTGEVLSPDDAQCRQIETGLRLKPGWLDEPVTEHSAQMRIYR